LSLLEGDENFIIFVEVEGPALPSITSGEMITDSGI